MASPLSWDGGAARSNAARALVVDLLGEQQTLHYDRHDGVGVDWDVVALEAVDVPVAAADWGW